MSTAKSHIVGERTASHGWELRIRCPRCFSQVGELRQNGFPKESRLACPGCSFQILKEDGVWRALPPAQETYFARFVREYETVRDAEKRGSTGAEYYLALPYKDLCGQNRAQWRIRAKTFDYFENLILPGIEKRRPRKLDILDLGAGNCWLSYRLALRGHSPVAVDLLVSQRDGLAAGAHYQRHLPNFFPRFQADLNCLPFSDKQFDVAIFNASLHYSEDYFATLAETLRCLRDDGCIVIADTAWYKRSESGHQMVAERRRSFTERFGFPSDALASQEFLTDSRLEALALNLGIRWKIYKPFYGLRWALRPINARWKGLREPSRFRIYVGEVTR